MRKYCWFSLCLILLPAGATATEACGMTLDRNFRHAEMTAAIPVLKDPSGGGVLFVSQMQVNPDGAPDAYSPDDQGTVHVCNGVSVGPRCEWKARCLPEYRQALAEGFRGPTRICFFAMATDRDGRPLLQGPQDPDPGYFISTTALKQPGRDRSRPEGQIDSNTVPFAVIPKNWNNPAGPGPRLGDFGVAYRKSNGKLAYFVVADLGPNNKLGEGSVALHQALGNDPFMQRFGVRRARRGIGGRDVAYLVFPDSADPRLLLDARGIAEKGEALLAGFGGLQRLQACANSASSPSP